MSSPPKGWAGFGALKEAQLRRKQSEDQKQQELPVEPLQAPPTLSPRETLSSPATVAPRETLSSPATLSKTKGQPFRNERVAAGERVSPHERVSPGVRVDFKAGYCEIPNYILDNLYPMLDPIEQVVYQRLFRLSHGFGRDNCEVSLAKLTETTKVKKTRLIVALRHLETLGLIDREASILGGSRSDRGNRYRILLPETTLPPGERVAPGERVSSRATLSPGGHIKKNIKEIHEKSFLNPESDGKTEVDPVYDVRIIAARLYEALRQESDFTPVRLRDAVETVLLGEGKAYDDDTITRAIKGMV